MPAILQSDKSNILRSYQKESSLNVSEDQWFPKCMI